MSDEKREQAEGDRREARRAAALLALLAAAYLVFLWFHVPRLNNFVYSDREFTGWVGPIAERVTRGERLYDDFILPIPPGSFALLSLIQRVTGRAVLLQELWVAGLCHLLMGLFAYAIAVRLSSRKVGLLVATTTLVLVTQTPKECVYDHTSLVVAWLAVLTGSVACLSRGTTARRAWFVTGLLSSASLGFKQSTTVGMVAGWTVALLYLHVVAGRSGRSAERKNVEDGARVYAVGIGAGLVIVALLLLAVGARPDSFVRAVLVDGPRLKGGLKTLLLNLFLFGTHYDAIRNTTVPTLMVVVVALFIARRQGSLHVGEEGEPRRSLGRGSILMLGAAPLLVFGIPAALLAAGVRGLQPNFTAVCEGLRNVPAYGFVYAAVFFAAHLGEWGASTEARRARGHALNAVVLASLTCSMIYDTSFVEFIPFYYNEPVIPIALLCLFIATERSRIRFMTPLVFAVCLLPTFGVKLGRALSDDTPVTTGHWAGLVINYRGEQVMNAAARARELAGPNGTVLVLPEDVQLVGLVERPRPNLAGAIVFVDQYPARVLAKDMATLDRDPPDVIILHPRRARDWRSVFHTWTRNSPAEQMMDHVLTKLLPKKYVLDSTYPSIYFWDQGQIDVYSRKGGDTR
jgi:hypothetical protein